MSTARTTTPFIFSKIPVILPRTLIYYFDPQHKESFTLLAKYLLILMDNNLYSLDSLNDNFVVLLRYDWSPDKFSQLSTVMRTVLKSADNPSRDVLFLEVLSEMTANLDDFEFEDDRL